jgi:hypothetical protein
MVRSTLAVLLAVTLFSTSARAEDWVEKMYRQVNRKVTFELVDTPLSDAVALISSVSGLNIIIAPTLRAANPTINLRVSDMDAGTAIKWITELTNTHAELADHAIFITDKPSKKVAEQEKQDLILFGAQRNVVIDVPPEGQALTDQDRMKIALQLMETEKIKVQDFPGPHVGFDTQAGATFNFQAPGN